MTFFAMEKLEIHFQEFIIVHIVSRAVLQAHLVIAVNLVGNISIKIN